ncbi:hypothetical protein [Rubripirellula obstinata]|uniref:hypothetical protein n=1 Tax=Rubripirellula obstinata TaxID=406547 RepID=UPI00082F8F2A|nr:hypothetical protein [Rubripirellula obstinata]
MTDSALPHDETTANRIQTRRWCVILLYTLAAFWGVAQIASPNNVFLYYLSALLFAGTATCWASLDFRIQGRRFPGIVPLIYFLTWPAATLAYLVYTRGFRGLGYWALHALGLVAILMFTFVPSALLLDWLGWINLDEIQ